MKNLIKFYFNRFIAIWFVKKISTSYIAQALYFFACTLFLFHCQKALNLR